MLIDHDRLDGWLNFAYRALKDDRDGRTLEARLDAAESVPWLLDVVFAMAGRVRPYNKYLPWELRTHPVDGWPADDLLGLVERTLEGDVDAIRETFARVRPACSSYDRCRGHTRTTDMVEGWGRGAAACSGARRRGHRSGLAGRRPDDGQHVVLEHRREVVGVVVHRGPAHLRDLAGRHGSASDSTQNTVECSEWPGSLAASERNSPSRVADSISRPTSS